MDTPNSIDSFAVPHFAATKPNCSLENSFPSSSSSSSLSSFSPHAPWFASIEFESRVLIRDPPPFNSSFTRLALARTPLPSSPPPSRVDLHHPTCCCPLYSPPPANRQPSSPPNISSIAPCLGCAISLPPPPSQLRARLLRHREWPSIKPLLCAAHNPPSGFPMWSTEKTFSRTRGERGACEAQKRS